MKITDIRPGTPRTRLALSAAVIALASAGAVVGGSAAAQADSSFTIHITPNNTGLLLLDVNGASTSPGTGVIDWYANGGANQSWTFESLGSSTYELVNGNSGQCLTTDMVAGDQVVQMPCNGGLGQRWYTGLTPGSTSAWTIENPYSGLYLDVNSDSPWAGTSIDVWYYNGGANQFFAAL
jgi:hypothetical protein